MNDTHCKISAATLARTAALALALTFSLGAPLALAAQPEEPETAAAAQTQEVQETDRPTLLPETPELAAEDPEAPPAQATEAEENSVNQHTPENSVVLTPEQISEALDAGALNEAEAQCLDFGSENGFYNALLPERKALLRKKAFRPVKKFFGKYCG